MLRKIGFTLLCATGLFSTNAFSITEHMFTQATAYEFTLPSNDPQIFTNIFFSPIEAKCTIVSDTENNPIRFTVLRKSGSLNGTPLAKGDGMDLLVHPGDQLYITAESGSRVELVNYGETTIKASCGRL